MSANLLSFVGKLDKAATGIQGAAKVGVEAASLAAKKTMVAGAEAVNTPKTINRGRGKKKNAWGVKYLFYTTEAKPRTVVYYFGAPPYWREQGTKDHDVTPRKGHTALLINELFATSAHVRGVGPRPFWEPVKVAVAKEALPILHEAELVALVKAGYT